MLPREQPMPEASGHGWSGSCEEGLADGACKEGLQERLVKTFLQKGSSMKVPPKRIFKKIVFQKGSWKNDLPK